MLKKFSILVSVLYTLALSILSLLKVNDIVEDIPSFNDKIGHALAHFIFVILWFFVFYYKFSFKYNKALVVSSLFSLVYGISIELLQGWITVSRESDFKDVLANVLGMIFASLVLLGVKKRLIKKNNSLLF